MAARLADQLHDKVLLVASGLRNTANDLEGVSIAITPWHEIQE